MSTKVMLITGSRKGIGQHLVTHYIKCGYFVIGCSRGDSTLVDDKYKHYSLDVADEEKAKMLFRDIRRDYGRLDVLINNAGVASMNHSLLTPVKTVKNILDTNVLGNFIFSREAAKIMKKNSFGRIVNFATFAIPFRLEGEAIYAASKAAVITLTQILSREYAKYGITVNAVAPPAVKTDLIKGVPKQKLENLLNKQSINRFGSPDEVAHVIDFLINSKSDMVNGEVIFMGGL